MKTSAFLLLSVLCALSDAAPDPGPPDTAPIPDNVKTATQAARAGERAAALKRWHDAKFGLFLHWGVYSVYGGTYAGKELWSAEWIQENARIPHAEYAQTAAAWNRRTSTPTTGRARHGTRAWATWSSPHGIMTVSLSIRPRPGPTTCSPAARTRVPIRSPR
ncbi:MAG: alpha-L-fucosidase [Kiritimatiellia bacterium]